MSVSEACRASSVTIVEVTQEGVDKWNELEQAKKKMKLVDSTKDANNVPTFLPQSLRVEKYKPDTGEPLKSRRVVYATVGIKQEASDSDVEFVGPVNEPPRLIPSESVRAIMRPKLMPKPKAMPQSRASSSTDIPDNSDRQA